jgi:glycosyltransferase involved in cell wall biosynthesis
VISGDDGKVTVSIIIPAFNEERNIRYVLEPLCTIKDVGEVVVVNDGSTDKTSETARALGVRVIDLPQNRGKSHAMWTGLNSTSGDIVLFIDADLIGLKPEHVRALYTPIEDGLADMTIGVFSCGRGFTDLAQKLTPFLSGQRGAKREFLMSLDKEEWISGYGIEIALTRHAKESGLQILEVPLENVTQTVKEEKMGLAKGMKARLKMYWEIAREINRV